MLKKIYEHYLSFMDYLDSVGGFRGFLVFTVTNLTLGVAALFIFVQFLLLVSEVWWGLPLVLGLLTLYAFYLVVRTYIAFRRDSK